MKRCFRCRGQKKLFKIGAAYSLVNTGGKSVDCPLCMGKGEIEPPKVIARNDKKKAQDKAKDFLRKPQSMPDQGNQHE